MKQDSAPSKVTQLPCRLTAGSADSPYRSAEAHTVTLVVAGSCSMLPLSRGALQCVATHSFGVLGTICWIGNGLDGLVAPCRCVNWLRVLAYVLKSSLTLAIV